MCWDTTAVDAVPFFWRPALRRRGHYIGLLTAVGAHTTSSALSGAPVATCALRALGGTVAVASVETINGAVAEVSLERGIEAALKRLVPETREFGYAKTRAGASPSRGGEGGADWTLTMSLRETHADKCRGGRE